MNWLSYIVEPPKPQNVRVFDVVLVGPLMIWGGTKLAKDYPVAGHALAALGGLTISYNLRNYFVIKEQGSE